MSSLERRAGAERRMDLDRRDEERRSLPDRRVRTRAGGEERRSDERRDNERRSGRDRRSA